jgi:hypothetical protein
MNRQLSWRARKSGGVFLSAGALPQVMKISPFLAVLRPVLWVKTALTTVSWWTILKLNLRNSRNITDVWGFGYVFA